ncbi:MAG: type II toxin-antitoxin system VapC family toxin [Firmicutes bacterium]|nr:type II toxin-antitoxin system VapC family toxin [Bacillota bacterium]
MRLLLDTQVCLGCLADAPRWDPTVRRDIEAADAVFVSAASIWEASIKAAIGRLQADPAELVAGIERSGYEELPVRAVHAALVARLPPIHKDPFDRLLVAQAVEEPLILVTGDRLLGRYSDLVRVV